MKALIVMLSCVLSLNAWAEPQRGEVKVRLAVYTALLGEAAEVPRPAPAAYAIGVSQVRINVSDREPHDTAGVHVSFGFEVFENEWTLVPVLAAGVALTHVSVNGQMVELVERHGMLHWSTDKAGRYQANLSYRVDARHFETGRTLAVPVPSTVATGLRVYFPDTKVDLAVLPAINVATEERDGHTILTANVPATSAVMVSWRAGSARPYVMSRARYQGVLTGDALTWQAEFDVELFSAETITLPLMPSVVTLGDIRVDGERATVLEEDGRFATLLKGKGMHLVQVGFEVPILSHDGPPQAKVLVPAVPVSQFELELPGRKELTVAPCANINTEQTDTETLARVFVPMTEEVVFSWTDSIPDDLKAQVRANASLFHVVHADEGVLHGRGVIVYEISRGETNQLDLKLPVNAQVNRIVAPAGGVSDWAESTTPGDELKTVSVFLDRGVKGEFVLDVAYEYLLGATPGKAPFLVPTLTAVDVDRQRGMVALLAGPELALKPVEEQRVSRVGENQLPAFIREQIAMTVAHTYKYTEAEPVLRVQTVSPERRQGKFDAQVDTLVSIGEVTLRASASVEINVKSGSIMSLALNVPAAVNVLAVSAPSLRSHTVRADQSAQVIELEFTQEMQGQFRLEVNYEHIMSDSAVENQVPTVSVRQADVEHGRIAIEALSALEIQAVTVEQLSSLDLNELPQQLVLKTTNPILLAYKYVHAESPVELGLKITRHEEIDVQVASIELAHYATLFTRDGLAVTTANYLVRNARRQFLRLDFPPDTEIWSVFANGKAEKPAHASDTSKDSVLIRMINSISGFPVQIVYATRVDKIEFLGSLGTRLPKPDMVVTRTRWDVFLPTGPRYRTPRSTLDVLVAGRAASPDAMLEASFSGASLGNPGTIGEPLRITVPRQGVQFSFEKLYANQSPEEAALTIDYVSSDGSNLGRWLAVAGVIVTALGLWMLCRPAIGRRSAQVCLVAVGLTLVMSAIGYLGTELALVGGSALVLLLLAGASSGLAKFRERRAA